MALERADKQAVTPFHTMVVQGEAGAGKTYTAAAAPGKVVIQSTDNRWGPVIKKMYPQEWIERFLVQNYLMEVDLTPDEVFKGGDKEEAYKLADKQAAAITKKYWHPFVSDFRQALADDSVRSIVWDQADELNDILRMANFGKIERNSQIAYGPVNAEWKGLLKASREKRKTLIMIHQVGDRWKNVPDPQTGVVKGVNTGERVQRGSHHADYLIDSFIEARYYEPKRDSRGNVLVPGRFTTFIRNAKLNPEVNGVELDSPDWPTLMSFLDPSVEMEAWV